MAATEKGAIGALDVVPGTGLAGARSAISTVRELFLSRSLRRSRLFHPAIPYQTGFNKIAA